MKNLPSDIVDAASKGDVYNTTNALMNGALLIDGAASLTKAGVGVVQDANTAAKAAAVDAKALEAAKVENNVRIDDAQQYIQYQTDKGWDWQKQAPNNGAVPGTTQTITLQKGTFLDRYGSDGGTYLSPAGTPYEARGLAPGSKADGYSQFQVAKPFSVEKSEVAPAFDQPGGGVQYRIVTPEGQSLRVNVDYLIKNGYLVK